MQKIDFHYNVPDRLRYACLVARTVYRRGLTLAVWTADERRLRELDSLLWRFDDLAFLPHVRAGSPLAGETPIRLSNRLEELEGDVLLLLDDQLPPEWQERLDRATLAFLGDRTFYPFPERYPEIKRLGYEPKRRLHA